MIPGINPLPLWHLIQTEHKWQGACNQRQQQDYKVRDMSSKLSHEECVPDKLQSHGGHQRACADDDGDVMVHAEVCMPGGLKDYSHHITVAEGELTSAAQQADIPGNSCRQLKGRVGLGNCTSATASDCNVPQQQAAMLQDGLGTFADIRTPPRVRTSSFGARSAEWDEQQQRSCSPGEAGEVTPSAVSFQHLLVDADLTAWPQRRRSSSMSGAVASRLMAVASFNRNRAAGPVAEGVAGDGSVTQPTGHCNAALVAVIPASQATAVTVTPKLAWSPRKHEVQGVPVAVANGAAVATAGAGGHEQTRDQVCVILTWCQHFHHVQVVIMACFVTLSKPCIVRQRWRQASGRHYLQAQEQLV